MRPALHLAMAHKNEDAFFIFIAEMYSSDLAQLKVTYIYIFVKYLYQIFVNLYTV